MSSLLHSPSRYDASPPPLFPSNPPPGRKRQPVPRSRIRLRPSLFDELLPTPASQSESSHTNGGIVRLLRRVGSLGVVVVFLLSVAYLASTGKGASNGAEGLKNIFGGESEVGWSVDNLNEPTNTFVGSAAPTGVAESESDFERYTMLRTLAPQVYNASDMNGRVIFIGDVHGSLDPLLRLMRKISYDPNADHLVHVGDLVAKGPKSEEVITWMNQRHVQGVRGNHDQTVLQWRAWMEWAGGNDWMGYVDSLPEADGQPVIKALTQQGKMYPDHWKWKGQHWDIARNLAKHNYLYLLELPLILHIPSLHSIIVHAGLLPHDPLKSASDPSQPLFSASSTTADPAIARISEEISLLLDVPQNQDPWTLLNMRSIYTSGKQRGKATKSSKKGTPWSDVWAAEMERCSGPGKWVGEEHFDEWEVEHEEAEDPSVEGKEDGETDELAGQHGSPLSSRRMEETDDLPAAIDCSPVTVIYGHAAGRGLDIKPFSKGLDTGCAYGRQLTALVLGDNTDLEGQSVTVGEHRGMLVSGECGEGGT